MIRAIRTLVAVMTAAMMMVSAGPMPAGAQESCLSNRDLQAAIARGDIAPVAEVLQREGIDKNTEVLSVEACQSNGGLAYYIGVIDAQGQARTLVLQASS